jgi:hypothetical protein
VRGKKTAKISIGHKVAMSGALRAIQVSPLHPGLPNSSRVAATVADNGFHSEIAPSQPGHRLGRHKGVGEEEDGPHQDLHHCPARPMLYRTCLAHHVETRDLGRRPA